MHVLSKLLVPAAVLVLMVGCGGSSAKKGAAPADGDAEIDDAGSRLSRSGLAKEDYARIRGELDCAKLHFGADVVGHDKAVAAIYKRYDTTPTWVAEVDELTASSPFSKRILDGVAARKSEFCPGGKIAAEHLSKLSP